jgi:hypothetical protein
MTLLLSIILYGILITVSTIAGLLIGELIVVKIYHAVYLKIAKEYLDSHDINQLPENEQYLWFYFKYIVHKYNKNQTK